MYQINICIDGKKTNAFRCSSATDEPCFYDMKTGYCIPFAIGNN